MSLNKLTQIAVISAATIMALAVAYYFVIFLPRHNQPIEVKNSPEAELQQRFKEFSDRIDVGLCQQVYDEFVSAGSKQRKGYGNFQYHCDYRQKDWKNFAIQNTVFSGDDRADVKYSYDLSLPDTYSADFNRCLARNSDDSFFFCSEISPHKIEKRETIETWLLEEGKWKRDY